MASFHISGRACTFTEFGFRVELSLTNPPEYSAKIEATKLAEVQAAVQAAQAATAGRDMVFSVYQFGNGRKPAGFKAWHGANRGQFFSRRAQPAEAAA
jgi:hypothetical protein